MRNTTKTKSMPAPRADVDPGDDVSAFDLGSLLGYRLLRLSTALGHLADREAQEAAGLTLPEYRVLVILHSHGPSGVSALQQALLIDKAWISRTLASLVAKKLVVSNPDVVDARRTVFRVTPDGARSAVALIDKALARQKRILRGLARSEVDQLLDVLGRIQSNVDARDA
jgi:DNA-binding MarR family transcriptional regulator